MPPFTEEDDATDEAPERPKGLITDLILSGNLTGDAKDKWDAYMEGASWLSQTTGGNEGLPNEEVKEEPPCDCSRLAGVIPSGAWKDGPDHICEHTRRASVVDWAKPFLSLGDDNSCLVIPLDDELRVVINDGTGNGMRFPAPVIKGAGLKPYGGVELVIREWVEEECDKLEQSFNSYPDMYNDVISITKEILADLETQAQQIRKTITPHVLEYASRDKWPEAWRREVEAWEKDSVPDLGAISEAVKGRAKTTVERYVQKAFVSETGLLLIERIRRQALSHTCFPQTPGTAAYFLRLVDPDHPALRLLKYRNPTRGVLVVSLMIVPGIDYPELPGVVRHQINFSSPFMNEQVYRRAYTVAANHAKWWEKMFDEFRYINNRSQNGRIKQAPEITQALARDIDCMVRGEFTQEQVVARHVEREKSKCPPEKWTERRGQKAMTDALTQISYARHKPK